MKKRFLRRLFSIRNIHEDYYRMYTTMNYVYIIGIVSHIMMLVFFFSIDLKFMGYFNIISILAFVTAYLVNRKGLHYLPLYLGGIEIFVHAMLSIYFLGWDSGFHYYGLIVGLAVFLANVTLWLRILIAILSFSVYLGIYLYSNIHPPAFPVDDILLQGINMVNMFVMFLGLSMLAVHYRKAADTAERDLRQERNKLKRRNMIIEKELDLARKIQLGLIPEQSPSPRISFYYKPMMKVGGDFLDFITFKDTSKTGIFVSDVSGHGVPAALLTSMIKSFFLQTECELLDPACLLLQLNDFMFHQGGGNFITAFYGILDWKSLRFDFANAGHNPPFILGNDRFRRLESPHASVPLLTFTNKELTRFGKSYTNDSIVLDSPGKLLLYTDGLTEAVRIQDQEHRSQRLLPDFESEELELILKENAGIEGKDFVNTIVRQLEHFRGSNDFEDDVCIICLDL